MAFLNERLPRGGDVISVLAASIFVVFSWSLRGFFELLPSFIESHKTGVIFAIFSYMMAFALFESLLLTSVLVLLCILLPGKWYKDGFAYKGLLTVIVLAVCMILLQKNDLMITGRNTEAFLPGIVVASLALFLSIILAHFISPLQRIFMELADRMQIFLYVYIPLGVLGLLVVMIRNLV